MSENVKTLIFVGVAVLVLAIAFFSRPTPISSAAADDTGQPFFPEFDDELAATSLEIVKFDEDSAQQQEFRVAQIGGRWSIPSKMNYPADAASQLAEAASGIMDLEKLGIAGDVPTDHALFGVVDPTTAKPGTAGVGTLVVMRDAGNKPLAQLIIGKPVEQQSGLRYVRVPGQNRVYRAQVSTEKLSTSFRDWIEQNLLNLNPWDISIIRLNNYSIDEVNQRIEQGDRLTLTFNDAENKWSLDGLQENEELKAERLEEMKNALGDLHIVDVRKKPDGLGRDLKTGEGIALDAVALQSLASRGFVIANNQLLSNEGEILIQLKDGVEYVLRFGEVAIGTETDDEEQPLGEDEDVTSVEANRFVFITAQFNPDALPEPQLQPLPEAGETPEGETPPSEEELAAVRERVEQSNQRLLDQHQEKVAAAQAKVQELNDRFADWYFVISDKVYRQIRVARSEIVQPLGAGEGAEAAEDNLLPGAGLDVFNQLRDQMPAPPQDAPQSVTPPAAETPAAETPEAAMEEKTTAEETVEEPAPPAETPSEEAPAAEEPPAEAPATEPAQEPDSAEPSEAPQLQAA